ncbi:MAG: ATP-binding protein [Planctomycetaceae bacterium]
MKSEEHHVRQDLLELAAAYADYSVLVTTADLEQPGPQILFVNSAFTRMTGYSIAELMGKTPRILQGPATDRSLLNQLKESLKSGQNFIARTTNYKRDGTPFELEWIISPLRNNRSQTTHLIALQRDITGNKRAASELHEVDDELRQASRKFSETVRRLELAERSLLQREKFSVLGEVTAGVIHDVANAISPIFGIVQLLNDMVNVPDDIKPRIDQLVVAVEHAERLLTNLRSFYQNSTNTNRTLTDLRSLLEHVPKLTSVMWQSENQENRIDFVSDLEMVQPTVANEVELTQVIVNLLSNAVEAMTEGGELRMTLREANNQAVIQIADTGHGIPDAVREQLFQPYVTSKATGTGLGLCLSKRIVESHGGTLEAAPNTPRGTVFTIRLPLVGVQPLATAQPSAEAQQQVEHRNTSEKQRILHIDQDAVRRKPLDDLLAGLGHTVDVAVNGDDGLRQFFNGTYDLVIAAAEMQPTSGRDVIQAIKRASPEVATAISIHQDGGTADNLPDYLQPEAILKIGDQRSLEPALRRLGLLSDS